MNLGPLLNTVQWHRSAPCRCGERSFTTSVHVHGITFSCCRNRVDLSRARPLEQRKNCRPSCPICHDSCTGRRHL